VPSLDASDVFNVLQLDSVSKGLATDLSLIESCITAGTLPINGCAFYQASSAWPKKSSDSVFGYIASLLFEMCIFRSFCGPSDMASYQAFPQP
jgi:hypothetical protein